MQTVSKVAKLTRRIQTTETCWHQNAFSFYVFRAINGIINPFNTLVYTSFSVWIEREICNTTSWKVISSKWFMFPQNVFCIIQLSLFYNIYVTMNSVNSWKEVWFIISCCSKNIWATNLFERIVYIYMTRKYVSQIT